MKSYISRRNFSESGRRFDRAAAALGITRRPSVRTACSIPRSRLKNTPSPSCTPTTYTLHRHEAPELTYASIEALKRATRTPHGRPAAGRRRPHQGNRLWRHGQGRLHLKLMNSAGYDLATLGNHEFDYGMDRILEIVNEEATSPTSAATSRPAHRQKGAARHQVLLRGGRILAFIGVTTPRDHTKSTPAYFMDAGQNEYIYGIDGGDDGQELYEPVQKAIDEHGCTPTLSSAWATWAWTAPPRPGPAVRSSSTPSASMRSSTATPTPRCPARPSATPRATPSS